MFSNYHYVLFLSLGLTILVLLPGFLMPYNMDDEGQAQQGLYVLDLLNGGNFFLPMEHGTIFASKPPMYNWLALPFCAVLGLNEISIKFPSLLSSVAMVILVFIFAYRIFQSRLAASASVLVLITSYGFLRGAGTARPDVLLSVTVLAALYFFYVYYTDTQSEQQCTGKYKIKLLLPAYFSLAIGTLTKGPVNLVLVFVPLVIFIILEKQGSTARDALKKFFPPVHAIGWLLFVVIVSAWFIPAALYGKWPFIYIVFIREMFFRVVDPSQMAGRTQPVWYFVPYFMGWFMPWTIFLAGAYLLRKKIYTLFPGSEKGVRLLAITMITSLIFFSIPKGKRCDYILLMYPCGAILVAGFFSALCRLKKKEAGNTGNASFNIVIALILVIGLLLILVYATGMLDAAMQKFVIRRLRDMGAGNPLEHAAALKHNPALLFAGIVTILSGLAAAVLKMQKRFAGVLVVITLCFACLNMVYFLWILPFFETKLSIKPFCEEIDLKTEKDVPLNFVMVNSNELFFRLKRNEPNVHIFEAIRSAKNKGRIYAIMPRDKEKLFEQTYSDVTFKVINTSGVKKNGDYQVLVEITRLND